MPPSKRPSSTSKSRRPALSRLDVEEALLALLIGAMNANHHVSPEEGARAHNIIWSMRRFRRKSGETVERLIDRVRQLIEAHGPERAVAAAARALPARLRKSAFAVAADLVLSDGRLEPSERRYLIALGRDLALDANTINGMLDVMRIKNAI